MEAGFSGWRLFSLVICKIRIAQNNREDLQIGSKTCHNMCFGDGSTHRKTGGQGRVGRIENIKIFIGSDHERQDYK